MEVTARYGEAADVAWKVGRIMLKYRPIAPKPLTGGAVPAGPIDIKSGSGRGKRKGAGGINSSLKDGGRRGRKSTKRSPASASPPASAAAADAAACPFLEMNENINNTCSDTFSGSSSSSPIVTLPLLPGTPEPKEESPAAPSPTASDGHVPASYFAKPITWQQHVGAVTNNKPVGSLVTVECVTDTWREGEAGPLGCGCGPAGPERDACPLFVSDAYDRVTWTNAAYKRMVVGPGDEDGEEVGAGMFDEEEEVVRVALATRGLVPADSGVACFTCRVRVRYACRRRGKVSMAAPCDVWRLADGTLAWRLDVKAALSLGLGI